MLHVAKASTPEILETAFAAIAAAGPGALLVMQDALLFNQHPRIVAFAAASRLPALFAEKQVVESGGLMALMAYGASIPASFRRAAVYVVKYTAALAPPICRLRPRQHSSSRSILKHELNSFSEEYRHELHILRIAIGRIEHVVYALARSWGVDVNRTTLKVLSGLDSSFEQLS